MGTGIGFLPPIVVIEVARRRANVSSTPQHNPLAIAWFPNVIATVVAVPIAAMIVAAVMSRTRPATRT